MSPVTWVTPDWVREHLADPDFILLDPRRPMKYMSGHLRRAPSTSPSIPHSTKKLA